jgi:hypothetical protein
MPIRRVSMIKKIQCEKVQTAVTAEVHLQEEVSTVVLPLEESVVVEELSAVEEQLVQDEVYVAQDAPVKKKKK